MNEHLTQLIADHTVDIYDSTVSVAEAVSTYHPRKIRLFTRTDYTHDHDSFIAHEFLSPTAASLTSADVCMLDGHALKVLAVRYPSDAQYILARFAPRRGWVLGVPGLFRRWILGRVRLGGLVRLGGTHWLVIHRTKKTVKTPPLMLAKSIGPTAFFAWMKNEGIRYVVPRFYENLPNLHRDDGDLDLLVTDEDAPRVVAYLHAHADKLTGTTADSIPIGLHTITRSDGVPYYPPPIARKIIDNAIDGPAGSRIPTPEDALHALIYHALYHHKGYATKIPSALPGKPEHPPENDYGAIIQQKARECGIAVGATMEELDDYMASIGWQPKRDTLSKIAQRNAWVRDRFFAGHDHGGTGLTVYILKEFGLLRGIMDEIVEHLRADGLTIIRAAVLTEEQKREAAEQVRGGNWVDTRGTTQGMLPAAIIIGVDPQCANLPPAYAGEYERVWAKRRKHDLRKVFDEAGASASVVHAADNSREAWEYIEACFPADDVVEIQREVEAAAHAPRWIRMTRWFSPIYIKTAVMFTVRDFVTNRL